MSIGPIEAERRHQAIAAIHAYADWLAANPDVPIPTDLSGTVHPLGAMTRSASAKIAGNMADNHNGIRLSGGNSAWATVPVLIPGPVRVKHTMFLAQDKPVDEQW